MNHLNVNGVIQVTPPQKKPNKTKKNKNKKKQNKNN